MTSLKIGFALLFGTAFMFAPITSATSAGVRTIALSGLHAPGTLSGIRYRYFNDPPVINKLGDTAFEGVVIDPMSPNAEFGRGVWTESNGMVRLVAGAESDSSNPHFSALLPVSNELGQLAFFAARREGNDVISSVWIEQSGNLELIVEDGDPAPGTSNDVEFGNLINGQIRLNGNKYVAFRYSLKGDTVDSTNDIGIWSTSAGGLALVAREGSQAPGASVGDLFSLLREPVLNDAGALAFSAATTGDVSLGIWAGTPGNLNLVVRDSVDAPGAPAGVTFDAFNEPSINDAGRIAFTASLKGNSVNSSNNRGIWAQTPSGLELVARSGNLAPEAGDGITFDGFSPPVINAVGETAFRSALRDNGADFEFSEAIWVGTSENLDLIARTGTQAPDTLAGNTFTVLSNPVLNAVGQVAFSAYLDSGNGGSRLDSIGIWATDLNGKLQLVARSGDQLEVAPNDFREIDGILFYADTGTGDGRPSGFNDLGQIAFTAFFTDGSSGVFVSDVMVVPEPSSCAIMVGMFILVFGIVTLRLRETSPRQSV